MIQLEVKLVQEFGIKDLGRLKYLSRIEVINLKNQAIFFPQRKCLLDFLNETGCLSE